jgi:nucleoside-diphosphate-sugar epimerase
VVLRCANFDAWSSDVVNVLVIGSSGFLGRSLVAKLVDEGHELEAWSRRGEPASRERLRSRRVDLLAPGALPDPEGRPWEVAYHLAAHAVPRASFDRGLVLENLSMTARALDHLAARAPGCRAIVASSGLVYAPAASPRREDDPVAPRDPYTLSKLLCETWALSRCEALDVRIVRAFNQIGPGMPAGLLVPDLLERIGTGEDPLAMRGRDDGKDFLDLRDAVDAWAALAKADAPSGSVFNLCSGRETKVSALVAAILRGIGISREVRFADPRVEVAVGDPGKLRHATGWSPRRTLEETVQAILEARS